MKSMFGGNAQFASIFFLLQTFVFSTNMLLGETMTTEAIFNIRLETTSNNYDQYFIYADKYQMFQDLFFNRTITSIHLNYLFNDAGRIIDNIYSSYGETQYNGSFYSCQHFANVQEIQCRKTPGSMDSLSGKCTHGTGIQWHFKDEYLFSSYFRNNTIKEEDDWKSICYILLNNTIFTTKVLNTSSSLPPVTITREDSTALSSGVIAGITIGIVIAIIVIIIVILWRRKHNRGKKETCISHITSTNSRNAYNEQAIDTRGHNSIAKAHLSSSNHADDPYMEISNDISQINNSYIEIEPDYVGIDKNYSIPVDAKLSTIEASQDDYTYIEDTTGNGKAGALDDGYTTLDQTITGFDESVEQRQDRIIGVPNYNNVNVVIADDKEKTGRKKDVYSKLGEKTRIFQNDYGEFNEDPSNEEMKGAQRNTYIVSRNKDKERRKDVYSILRENIVHFQDTYGELDQSAFIGEEVNVPELEVNNIYFALENENPNVCTIDTETS